MTPKQIIKHYGIHWLIEFKQWHRENFNYAGVNRIYYTLLNKPQ